MVRKLSEDEEGILLNKYRSMGFTEQEAKRKLNRTISLMVVSAVTMIV